MRVMHPGYGMGIEFSSRTEEQRQQVADFIELLTTNPGVVPELLITPRALTTPENSGSSASQEVEDPLLDLLQDHDAFSQEEFLQELRKQRSSEAVSF